MGWISPAWGQKRNGKITGVEVGKAGSVRWWGLLPRPIMPDRRWRGQRAYPWDNALTQIILLHGIRWCWTYLGQRVMIATDHGCWIKGLMGCWRRTYSFIWIMGDRLNLPRNFAGKHPECGDQRAPGCVFMTPPERFNLPHRNQGHGLVPSPTLK